MLIHQTGQDNSKVYGIYLPALKSYILWCTQPRHNLIGDQ